MFSASDMGDDKSRHMTKRVNPLFHRGSFAFVTFVLLSGPAAAQSGRPTQITQTVDESRLTVLKGNTYPLARPEFDRGPAPLNLPFNRMLLVLQRSPEQESALKLRLEQLQDKSSSNYHAWLTPELFGQQFGPVDQDIQSVTSWLLSHGLQVSHVAKGRMIIEFSGTAGQVKEAFHTEIHRYEVDGKEHWANSADPQIPTGLTPVIAGIASLHNFGRRPLHHLAGISSRARNRRGYPFPQSPPLPRPIFTTGGDCGLAAGSCYAVSPYDFAAIYNVLPLWNATSPIDGTGQTIAIVGQSDIYPQDFSDFRQDFGLPSGTLNIIYNGSPPDKLATEGDELESDLDVQWSGAVAKGATIDLVASTTTNSTAGVDLSALYIVDNNLAPILSESYGACELELGTAGNQFYEQLWQQAAAEGISVFVSTGDSGSAVCDQNSSIATQGLSVSGISSTPYNVAVGGTDFDDLQNQSAYWNSTNDPVTQASAKGYIPESTWNDTCTNAEFFSFTGDTTAEGQCNDQSSLYWPGFLVPVGGSGGASNCTTSTNQSPSSCGGGYQKPAWQTGPGVPNDGTRDLPDVSLFAGDGLNSSFYLACETDIYLGCDGEIYTMVPLGGTSASAPAFAGIMAMINQKIQSRQGNPNYVLYPLAAQPSAICDSTGTIETSCIFYDVTVGTIAMPCVTGSPNCVTNTASDPAGVLSGYSTTAGYDLATGLGSVNVANLVNSWDTVSFQSTISTLAISPTTNLTHGTPVNVNLIVAPATGTGTPSGLASLLTSNGQPAGIFNVTNGAVSGTTDILPGGSYTVHAHYAGDGTYAASDSSPGIPVTVSAEPSTTNLAAFSLDQNGNQTPFAGGPYGGSIVYLSASVAGKSGHGVPTGSVNLTQTLNGTVTPFPGNPYALNSQAFTMVPFPGYNYFAYSPGTYSIAATYSGDESFNKSAAPGISFTITQAQTNTTTSMVGCSAANGICSANPGQDITILATVNCSGAAFGAGGVFIDQPTGSVTFYSNGTAIGPPAPVDSSVIPPVASISTTQLLGPNSITAQYSGDSNFSGSTSSPIMVDVGETFGITANPSAINLSSPGQSGSTTLTFTAQNGFTGSGTLSPSACSNLPSESSCSFSPTTVAFTSSTTSIPVTLTVSTTAPSSSSVSAMGHMPGSWRQSSSISVILIIGIFIVAGSTARRRSPILAMISLILIASAIACGGGSGTSGSGGGGGGGGSGNQGTPVGTYSVTVTITIGGLTQSLYNLNVNIQ
jgi:hypothetical protein